MTSHHQHVSGTKTTAYLCKRWFWCWRLPIFPGRFQPSIVGACELNCRVRDGNGCTLTAIDTNYAVLPRTVFPETHASIQPSSISIDTQQTISPAYRDTYLCTTQSNGFVQGSDTLRTEQREKDEGGRKQKKKEERGGRYARQLPKADTQYTFPTTYTLPTILLAKQVKPSVD